MLSRVRRLDTPLVLSRRDGRAPFDLRHAWAVALARAGVKDFRWHDLRHSAASSLAMQGATLLDIATLLGHKTVHVAQRYAHLAPQHTRDVLTRMNTAIFGGEAL